MQHVELEHIAHHRLDILDTRVAKLHHFMAIGADEMVVLPRAVRFFVLGEVTAKLVFGYQIAIDQYIERIIDRGAADAVIFVFHRDIQLIYVEMVGTAVNLLQNRESFGRFAKSFPFEVGHKNGARGRYIIGFRHWHNRGCSVILLYKGSRFANNGIGRWDLLCVVEAGYFKNAGHFFNAPNQFVEVGGVVDV